MPKAVETLNIFFKSEVTFDFFLSKKPVIQGPPPTNGRIDPSDTMLRGLLCWGREGSGKGAGVFCGGGLSLRGMGSKPPLEGLP